MDECLEGCAFGGGGGGGPATPAPWHISAVRVVAQTMPVPYAGSFSVAGDALLTGVWWTAALGPKLNMVPSPPLPGALLPSVTALDAVLMDRGDRVAWTGDDHIAQNAIMGAFGQHDFVRQRLWNTHNDSDGIMSYSVSVQPYVASQSKGTVVHKFIVLRFQCAADSLPSLPAGTGA